MTHEARHVPVGAIVETAWGDRWRVVTKRPDNGRDIEPIAAPGELGRLWPWDLVTVIAWPDSQMLLALAE